MSVVKKYMMKTLNSVCEDDLIADVIKSMHKNEMSVLPVVDHKNYFLGTIYSNNILKNIIPEQYSFMDTHHLLYEINQAAESLAEIKNRLVKEYMSKNTDAVRENEKMDNLAHIMLSNQESILFVTNDKGNLRGYISRADLLYYLLKMGTNQE